MSSGQKNMPQADHSHGENLRILLVDDGSDWRFLVSRALSRRFPLARLVESQTSEAAMREMDKGNVSVIILHRTFEFDGVTLVRELRAKDSKVPILMMSSEGRRADALAAGATDFLNSDEWLMVGTYVRDILDRQRAAAIQEEGLEPVP